MAKNQQAPSNSLPFMTLLDQGLLIAAFNRLINYGEKKLLWELTDSLKQLQQSYIYMIRYALSGTPDPQRDSIKHSIIIKLAEIYDIMRRKADSAKTSDLYFSTAASLADISITELTNRFQSASKNTTDFAEIISETKPKSAGIESEGLQRDIFNKIWTTHPLTENDHEAINSLLNNPATPASLRHLIIWAVALGNMKYFDDTRFNILSDTYTDSKSEKLVLAAIVGLLLSLYVNRSRPMSQSIINRVGSLRETKFWHGDLRAAALEFVRTHDTKRISDSMTDYFNNTFSKVGDTVRKSIRDLGQIDDLAELEENPEWMEMLEKTGLAEKMKELNEIQEEGGDVFLQPFKQLKGHRFFFEAANWFLPFDASQSDVSKIDPDGIMSEMVSATPFLCDNDKYSFMLAMGNIPDEQRKVMLSQLEAGNLGASAINAASLSLDSDRRRNIINKQIQSLYRFFNLFRRKDDFANPFNSDINLTTLPLLRPDFIDDEALNLIAEFYFKHKYYGQALESLTAIEQNSIPTPELFQKIGFSYQKIGKIENALRYYEQAELLNARSSWTIKRIAQCHMLLHNPQRALEYYLRLNEMTPDKPKVILSIARCLIELGKYPEALKHLYQANYLDQKSPDIRRALAWSLFAMGEKEKARPLFESLYAESQSISDRVNLAHLALTDRNVNQALSLYTEGIDSDEVFQQVVSAIAEDFPVLQQYGFDHQSCDLLIEAITSARLNDSTN